MTKISKSPLKHKQGEPHKYGTVTYGEELYHRKFGGNVKDDENIKYSDGVSPDLNNEEDTIKRDERVRLKLDVGQSKLAPPSKYANIPEMKLYEDSGEYTDVELETIHKRLINKNKEETKKEPEVTASPVEVYTTPDTQEPDLDVEVVEKDNADYVYRTSQKDGEFYSSWFKTTPGVNEGDSVIETPVLKTDVPIESKKNLREKHRKMFEEDPNSLDITEVVDLFRYDEDNAVSKKEEINSTAQDYLKKLNEPEPTTTNNEDRVGFQSWKQRQEDNANSRFGILYKQVKKRLDNELKVGHIDPATGALTSTYKGATEQDIIEETKALMFQEDETEKIKDAIKEYSDNNRTILNTLDAIAQFSPIVALTASDDQTLSKEQIDLQKRVVEYQKKIAIGVDDNGNPVLGPKILKNVNNLNTSNDLLTSNLDLVTRKADEIIAYGDLKEITSELTSLKTKINSLEEVAVDGKLNEEDYETYSQLLNKYKELYNANSNNIEGAFKAQTEYNELINNRKLLIGSHNLLIDDRDGMVEDAEDLGIFIDANRRDYGWMSLARVRLANSLIGLGLGMESLTHAVNPATLIENGLKEYYSSDPTARAQKDVPAAVVAILSMKEMQDAPREKIRNAIKGFQELQSNSIGYQMEWGDIESGNAEDYGQYIVGATADFLPQLAMLVVAPQSSLYMLAASSGGSKYDQMMEENKHGANYSMAQVYFATGITALAEYGSEKVTLGLINKTGAGLKAFQNKGFNEGIKRIFNPKNILKGAYTVGMESGSEGLAKMGENFGDIVAGKNISIYEGVPEAMFNGLIMSGIMTSPTIFKQAVSPFLPKDDSYKLQEHSVEMLNIEAQLAKLPSVSPTRTILENRLNAIYAENSKILSKTIDRVDEMTDKEKKAIFEADILRAETAEIVQQIKADKKIPVEMREKLISDAMSEFYKSEKNRNELIKEVKIRQDVKVAKGAFKKLDPNKRFEVIESRNEFQKIYDELNPNKPRDVRGVDAFFDPISGDAYVNKARAKEVGAISAGSHELLHRIMKSVINDAEGNLTTEGMTLINSFLNSIPAKHRAIIQKRIDDNYRWERGPNREKLREKNKNEYYEEYLNSYSDAIRLNQINPKDGDLLGIGRKFRDLFSKTGYTNDGFKFGNGNDVKNFIKDYAADIKSGEVRESILDVGQTDQAGADELATQDTDSVKKETYETTDDDGLKTTVQVTTAKDGSRTVRYKDAEGTTYHTETYSKDNTLTNEKIIELNVSQEADITNTETIEGWENLHSEKQVAKRKKEVEARKKKETPKTGAGEIKMSKSTPLEAINSLIPKDIKTKKDYDAFVQDRRLFPPVFNATMDNGVISNYVKSKTMGDEYRGAIDSVQNRLTNFDPEATRADGSVVGPEGFGEFIFANTRFGKLDSKKKLFKASEKAKKTTTIDAKEAKDIEDTSTPAEVEDKSKARNLRDFDIEVEDGLVNAEIEAEVEALLEKNPDDIEVQIEKLILGDIRKSLDGVIGKIAKDKKTGKRGPTAEYEAFIRNEYLEVVQSLGMETIRKAYRPWFEKKKIRTEKYKGISPKTGKATNYVKDVFENTTNKREYIRWFLESNERNLTERRTALIRRIARRKAKIATDNYIEANSKNLDKVAEAKLRKVSRAIEDTQTEQKSFDSIKFSRSMNVTKLNQEFGKIFERGRNGKPLIKKGTIWTGYINPYTNEPQNFVDKGRIWEQAFANYFMKNGIEGLKVLSEIASEVDGMADFVFEYNGKVENHELKASITAFMGSISISNLKNGKIAFATDTHNNLLEQVDMKKFMEGYKKRIDFVNKGIEKLNKKIKDPSKQYALIDYDITSGKPQNIPYELYMDKRGFGNKMFYQLKADQAVIENHYKSKKDKNGIGVRSLSFVGTKTGNMSFALDSESILNLPRLDANVDINFTFRNGGSKMVNGNKVISLSLGVQFKISKLNNKAEQSVDITIKEDLQKALGINFSKSINGRKISKAINFSRSANNPTKGITVLDFDDTLATSKSLVISTSPEGVVRKLTAEEFAQLGADLLDKGWTHDFSEFSKVVDGKVASLFNKAMKLQGKFGPENMFVLTARPANSAPAIFEFLKANGLNIPLKNITGLANSTPESKALWIADKVGDGYNDFYFADDALQNVQAVQDMLNQFDVKSKVQQAKVKFSKSLSPQFNTILENTTGVNSKKVFSEAQAKIRGAKTKYKSIIPPSAQDFAGLLYNFLGKGKKGEADMAFFKKALIDPFAKAISELNTSRQSSADDYKNLQKQFPGVKKIINKNIKNSEFTNDQAVRVYLWDKAGFEVPGLSQRDLKALLEHVNANSDLKTYADTVGMISKKEAGYSAPGDYWLAENITSDLLSDGAMGDSRSDFLAEWQQNADQIFSTENLNKIEAIYGSNFREALQDVLYRMRTGRNRPAGGGRLMNQYMNWVNNSVGAIMFFNMRSAILQTISATNYINWSDNNPLKAAAAFSNQPQYWKDFSMIFNSNYLKQRRSGNQRGINEAELSAAVAGAENKAKAAIAWLLKKGFLPTQIADSFAIASGGATFYRNRFKKYIKEGMSQNEAADKAFLDFQEVTEVSQQSARPDMISQQQASPLGRLILSFQNTPMQYARIMNKAARDLANGRGDYKTHVSKIAYYGVVQSIVFGALQSALFASLGEDDEEKFDKKKERILNGMIDSVLSGVGYGGKAVSTIKNTIRTFLEQRDKGFMADHTYTILSLLSFSPPIGSKLRKIYSAIQTDKFNKDVFLRRGFTLDNPIWSAIGNVVEGVTNVPLGRLSNKMLNVDNALDSNNSFWQRAALLLGWSTWDLGIKDPDIEGVKSELKTEKKEKKKKEDNVKKEIKIKEKEKENEAVIKENKKKSKKDGICSAVSKSGKRCKKKAINGGMCTIHEKAKQSESGKKVQCKKIKSNKKRCGMKTSSASGYCYYHD